MRWPSAAVAGAMLLAVSAASAQSPAGSPDPSFGSGGWSLIGFDLGGSFRDIGRCTAVRDDGVIVVAGGADSGSGSDWAVVWLTSGGLLNPAFGSGGMTLVPFDLGGYTSASVRSCALLEDGRLMIAGSVEHGPDNNFDMAVGRLTSTGALDPTFGDGGKVVIPFDLGGLMADYATDLAIQQDGKVVVVGTVQVSDASQDFGVVRLTPAGVLDASFGVSGTVTVAFDLGGDLGDYASGVAIQPDGRVVICGTAVADDIGNTDLAVVRLESDGALDPAFGAGGMTTVAFDLGGLLADSATGVAVLADGRILLAGTAEDPDYLSVLATVRLTADGILDPGFDGDGKATLPPTGLGEQGDRATSLVVQPDGRIVVAGLTDNEILLWQYEIGRFLPSGAPDPSFGSGGLVAFDVGPGVDDYGVSTDVALQPDNRIVVVGYVETTTTSGTDFGILRLVNDLVFADGFESGSTSAWSRAMP